MAARGDIGRAADGGLLEPLGGVNAGAPQISPKEMLETRAQLSDSPKDRQRKLFVRFDAWTDPRILRWLASEGKTLSPEARKLFYDDRPEIDIDVLRCAYELITRIPLARARTLAVGGRYGVKAKVEGRAKLLLDETGLTLKQLIRKLARYLHKIFQRHARSKRALPSKKFEAMFARFASGKLRIDDGRREWMNAEPDSAYFFAFAELCIQAAHFRAFPGRAWWIALGGLFSALQDVYCQRYHRKGAGRRFGDYQDMYFDDSRPIKLDRLLKQVASVRRRDRTIENLVDRVTWNAYWYFFDDVQ